MKKLEYRSYEQYLHHQQLKTSNLKVRRRLFKSDAERRKRFFRMFKSLKRYVSAGSKTICLGARTGAEVAAMRDRGWDAIGIDLVPYPPLVVEGDFHNIPFPDSSFQLAYSNSVDHVFDLRKFVSEVERVLKPGGIVFLQLLVTGRTTRDGFDCLFLESSEELISELTGFDVVCSRLNKEIRPYNWEVIARKK